MKRMTKVKDKNPKAILLKMVFVYYLKDQS